MSNQPVEPIPQETEADSTSQQAQTSDAFSDRGKRKPRRRRLVILVSIIILMIILLVGLIHASRLFDWSYSMVPATPQPLPIPVQVRETRVAAANAIAPSLVRETGINASITSAFGQDSYGGFYVYFDGRRLWVNQGGTWLAIDPESQEIVAGPIKLRKATSAIAFDGRRLWALLPDDALQSIDVDTGKLGPEIDVASNYPRFLAYDGERFWFDGYSGLQSVDLASRHESRIIGADDSIPQPLSPAPTKVNGSYIVGANGRVVQPCMVIVDDNHEFLWIVNFDGSVQKYDLKRNKLLDTPIQHAGQCAFDPMIYDDGRLWINGGSSWEMFDTQTGASIANTPYCAGCIQHAVLGDGRLWVTNSDLWTIQSFDAVTGQADPPIPLSSQPGALAFDGQRLWAMLFEPESGKFQGLQYIVPK